jgi:hypothetical protein
MKKIFLGILLALLLITGLVFYYVAEKNLFVKKLLIEKSENLLGLKIEIADLDVSPFATHLRIEGLKISNPEGFPEKEMAYIPSLIMVCDPIKYMREKKMHYYLIDLNVDYVNIIKNKDGLVNLKEIKPFKNREEKPKEKDKNKPGNYYVEIFRLNLGDIYYIQHTPEGAVKTKKYPLQIKNALFSNIDNPRDILDLIVIKIFSNTEIGKIINMNMVPIISDVSNVVELTGKTMQATIKGLVNSVTTPFKIIFDR